MPPPAADHLSERSRAHFQRVCDLLTRAGVPFKVNSNLVRGFDYYTETLWEVTAGGLGSQNALGGGGRYDNLIEQLGGRRTPGVGFGSGLERLLIALDAQGAQLPAPAQPLLYLISQSDAAREANFDLVRDLRQAGYPCEMDPSGRSMKAQFKQADSEKATLCLITGDTELAEQKVTIKHLATGEQTTVERAGLIAHLQGILSSR